MSENGAAQELRDALRDGFSAVEEVLSEKRDRPAVRRVGTVAFIGGGVARVEGLTGVRYGEVLDFPENVKGLAFDVDADGVGAVLLDPSDNLRAGDEVGRTDRVLDVPVGDALVGRVVDPMARPLDGRGPISTRERRPMERPAPEIMDRAPVTVPLQTGLKVVDALIPVGRGQRELILGDRQTGKTAVALDTFLNQRHTDVLCIYCAVGKRSAAVARVIATLREHGAMDSAIVMVTTEEDPPGRQYAAAYAATSMAEYFMEQGRDVLIVYDDLTRHARAYRELSLLLRRPPGREAFPGDIFYIHSRLLERATHLREELGGGSLTALPVVETEAQNLSAYIPTNLISITDGQIYLSPDLFRKGQLPAVDVGKSVSRVGGNAQLPAYRRVAGDLRLAFSQFEELEAFARFGTRLDEETRQTLRRGRRVREVLKQPQYQPRAAADQVGVLLAVNEGLFDELPPEKVAEATEAIRETVLPDHRDIAERIAGGETLSDEDADALVEAARKVVQEKFQTPGSNGEA